VLSIGAMTAVVYAIKRLGEGGPDSVGVLVLVAGLALGAAFVRSCLAQDEPMLAVRLFGNPVFVAGVITALVSSLVWVALLLVGSQWLLVVQGLSPLMAGVALLPLAVGGLVGPPLAPAVAGRIGVRPVMVGGLGAHALGMLVLVVLPRPMPYVGVGIALLVVGLGGAALGLASALIMGSAPAHQSGSAAAAEEMSYEVGAVLGVAVLGSVAGAVYRSGLPPAAPQDAVESIAGAITSPVAAQASAAFTESFAVVGLAGGLLALTATLVVYRLLPPDLALADSQH
jgi:DHA2 family multidrug resistance protein-like MFS transporter